MSILRSFVFLSLLICFRLNASPLEITITEGTIEPLSFAAPIFVTENSGSRQYSKKITQLIAQDLSGSGLFREVSRGAHISKIDDFDAQIKYSDWRAINAQILIAGSANLSLSGEITVKFRIFDVFAGQEIGKGLEISGNKENWRSMGHKVADVVYKRLTGENGYFDSRVVFVSETGPKNDRKKRLAIMDYDGANIEYLTRSSHIVFGPRFSPKGDRLLFTSNENGFFQVFIMELNPISKKVLNDNYDAMTFGPRFSPNGDIVAYSKEKGGNIDLYTYNLTNKKEERLTRSPSIETAPSFSPDGTKIVFESDKSGTQQLYVMSARGGKPKKISHGKGRYGTPVWSPRGDMIAFTKQNQGRFHIGVMRFDGSEERLLTTSFLDESPSWSPNGRVIMFSRETRGVNGESSLYSIDIAGNNERVIPTQYGASDPAWSP